MANPKAKEFIQYNPDSDRWQLSMKNKYDLHCGDFLYLLIDEHILRARIECREDWYVIVGNNCFYLDPNDTYEVIPF